MMYMRNKILFCVLLFSLSLLAQNNNIESEFVGKIKQYNSEVRSIKCNCTQKNVLKIFDKPVITKGMFYYLAENNIVIMMENGDYVKIIKGVLEMKNGKNVTKIKLSANPSFKNMNLLISSCFNGDISPLSSMYNILYSKNADTYKLVLQPKRVSKGNSMSVELLFDSKDMSLNSLKMIESKDNYTEYLFYNKQFNVDVNSVFEQ